MSQIYFSIYIKSVASMKYFFS